ncbi:MAG: mechanosensitive ion channel, partial [Bacteroidota bacterium]|nr:mechanosensitive ion channel [Bacteroidota bacterium]
FYIILVTLSITALNQVGIDTTLISSNILILFIALLATVAISFGIASKDFLVNILSTHYAKTNLKIGQKIKTGNLEGEIESISKVQVVLKTKTGKVLIPTKTLVSEPVEIIENYV